MAFTIPDSDVAAVPATQSPWYSTDIAILVAGHSGTGVHSGCAVSAQGSPDMTVAVATGVILAVGAAVTVTSGNLTVGTADGTNPRIDLISASAAGVKTITAGTAAANPKPPALPAGHIGLAFVDVPATDTTIGSTQITDKRVMVRGHTYLGYNTIGGTSAAVTANLQYMRKVTTPAAGVFRSIGLYTRGNFVQVTGISVGVLADAAGVPAAILASGVTARMVNVEDASPPSTPGWVHVPVGLYVPAAGDYWLAVCSLNNLDIYHDTGGSDRTLSNAGTGEVIADARFYTQSDSTFHYSIRASFET